MACYGGLIQKLRAEAGTDKTQLIVFAATMSNANPNFVTAWQSTLLTTPWRQQTQLSDHVFSTSGTPTGVIGVIAMLHGRRLPSLNGVVWRCHRAMRENRRDGLPFTRKQLQTSTEGATERLRSAHSIRGGEERHKFRAW